MSGPLFATRCVADGIAILVGNLTQQRAEREIAVVRGAVSTKLVTGAASRQA